MFTITHFFNYIPYDFALVLFNPQMWLKQIQELCLVFYNMI